MNTKKFASEDARNDSGIDGMAIKAPKGARLERNPVSNVTTEKVKSMELIKNPDIDEGSMGGFSVLEGDHKIIDVDAWRRLHPCSVKLFGAYSTWNDPKYGEQKMHWFYNERRKPVAPYQDLIYGYGSEDIGKRYEEDYVDECFTEEEIEPLREYIERVHGMKLHTYRIDFPVYNCLSFGAVGTFSIINFDANGIMCKEIFEDYYMMSEDEGYSLPFKVWGYYCINNPAWEI